jgi:hypothetical protein
MFNMSVKLDMGQNGRGIVRRHIWEHLQSIMGFDPLLIGEKDYCAGFICVKYAIFLF